ncbi:MAG: hypothetical protein AAGE94_23870, partial [Acidobacteriota bacterium]
MLELVDDELRTIDAPELPDDAELNFMIGTPDGGALVLARRYGLFRFDGLRLVSTDTPGEPWLIANQVQHGCELPDGRIAIGSVLGGVGLFDRELGRPEIIDEATDLPDNLVHFVHTDRHGHLWAGTNDGIARIKTQSSVQRLGVRDGIDGFVSTVLHRDGEVWVAAASGLFVDLDGVEPYRFEKVDVPEAAWDVVDVGDAVLVATSDGIFEVQVRRNADLALVVPREIRGEGATELFPVPGRPDEVLASLENGLGWYVRESGSWRWNGRVPGVVSEPRVGLPTADGELIAWAPGRDRLIRLGFDDEPLTPPTVRTHDLDEGTWLTWVDGSVIAWRSDGLERYLGPDAEGWPFEPEPSFAPLIDEVGGTPLILHQDGDLLWLNTGDGLRLAEPDRAGGYHARPIDADIITGALQVFGDHDRGQHFIASGDGLYLYRPTRRAIAEQPLQVLIRGVETPGGDAPIFGGFGPIAPLLLPPDQNDLRLELAASRVETEPIEYQIRLDEATWSDWDSDPTRDLSNLAYGDHRIDMRARDAWGAVSDQRTLDVRVHRPWWLSFWALALWTLGLAGLIAVAVRLRTHQLDVERRRLEDLIAERTQALAERKTELEERT